MNRLLWMPILLLVGLIAALPTMRLDVDIFSLLPRDSEQVEGLKYFQQHFGSANQLIVLLESDSTTNLVAAAEELASNLDAAGLAQRVVWRAPLDPMSADAAALLAYLWFNQPPGIFDAQADKFEPGRLEQELELSIERLAVSFQPREVALLGADPLGLTAVFERAGLPIAEQAGDPFASADGRMRFIVLESPQSESGFFATRRWVDAVEASVDAWRSGYPGIETGITGNPAFIAESGGGLMRDLLIAAASAVLMVALLFWLAHRSARPLGALVLLLVIVLGATAVLGSWIFGGLHAVALGFAAILLGLAADYGLILYQESRSHPEQTPARSRRAVAPAIAWSALTTAGAFFMISRSSLPGLTQLGALVALGILLAAVILVFYYLPLAGTGSTRQPPVAPAWAQLGSRRSLQASLGLVIAVVAVLWVSGVSVSSDARALGAGASGSRAVLDRINRDIGGFEDDHWLVIAGESAADVREMLERANGPLEGAVEQGKLAGYLAPTMIWPDPTSQASNRERLLTLAQRRDAVRDALGAAGFTDTRLTDNVLAGWQRIATDDTTAWPGGEATDWLLQRFVSREPGNVAALARLRTTADAGDADISGLRDELRSMDAGVLVSWTLLSDALLVSMNQDVQRVLVPMAVVLLLFLFAAHRSLAEVALGLACLGLSFGALLMVMSILGWSWNIMNMMALPMLFGAGIDYSLHVQFSMRRYGDDAAAVRNSVGRAILLCAASTAAGFASLGFASNAGIASLGRVCAVGILITAFTAVFLLPAWCQIMPGRNHGRETAQ